MDKYSKILIAAVVVILAINFMIVGCTSIDLNQKADAFKDVTGAITLECEVPENETGSNASLEKGTHKRLNTPLTLKSLDEKSKNLAESYIFSTIKNNVFESRAISRLESGESTKFKYLTNTDFFPERKLSVLDVEDFVESFENILSKSLSDSPFKEGEGVRSGSSSDLSVFEEYFLNYISKGFRTRKGIELSRAELLARYNAEAFGALTQIYIESLFDSKLSVPVLHKLSSENKKLYLPSESEIAPTAVTAGVVESFRLLTQEESHYCGITEAEYKLIISSSSASADIALRTSSILLESIGDLEVSFVVGAGFSIGDAETLPTIIKTLIATTVDNAQEAALYQFFYHFSYKLPTSGALESGGMRNIELVGVSFENSSLESKSDSTYPNSIKNLMFKIKSLSN